MMLLLLFLLGPALGQVAASSSSGSADHQQPACVSKCLDSYREDYAGQTQGCDPDDTRCVCKDRVMPPIMGCCMTAKCSGADLPAGFDWITWACGIVDVRVRFPDPLPCGGDKSTTTTASTTASEAGTSTSSSTSTSTTSSASSTSSSSSSSSESETTTTPEPMPTPPTAAETTPAVPTTTTPDPTTTTSQEPPPASPSTDTASPSPIPSPAPAPPFALPLGIGLGLGIPLAASALGLFVFLFWRSKSRSRAHHRQSPYAPSSSSARRGCCGCLGSAPRPESPVVSDMPYYVAPPPPPRPADKQPQAVEMEGRGLVELPSWVGR